MSRILPTVDTNILIYAIDPRIAVKAASAEAVLRALRDLGGIVGLQVVTEAFRVTTRKLGWHPAMAERYLRAMMDEFPTFAPTTASLSEALSLAGTGKLSIWDANLVTAARAAGCTHLFSEDMHDGLKVGDLEVVDPFEGDALSSRARSLLAL